MILGVSGMHVYHAGFTALYWGNPLLKGCNFEPISLRFHCIGVLLTGAQSDEPEQRYICSCLEETKTISSLDCGSRLLLANQY